WLWHQTSPAVGSLPGLWTREASWSAPRRRGAFDHVTRETSPGIGTDVLRDPLRPISIRGLASGRASTPAAASRPGVRRAAAALPITPPAKPAPGSHPPSSATHFARSRDAAWHLVERPRQQPLRVLECAAPPRRFRSRPRETSTRIGTGVLHDPLRPIS